MNTKPSTVLGMIFGSLLLSAVMCFVFAQETGSHHLFSSNIAHAQDELEDFILDENDIAPPTVVSAEAKSSTEVEVLFNEPIFIPEGDITQYFTITEEFDTAVAIEVLELEQDELDASLLTLTTDALSADTHYNLTVSSDITDLAGNPIVSGVTDTASFVGVSGTALPEEEVMELPGVVEEALPLELPDTEAPLEATNFMARLKEQMKKIELSWSRSISEDLSNQKVYTSTDDGKTYGLGVPVGLTSTKYDVDNLKEGQKYMFKLTSVDNSGNESAGITTIIHYLPQTGMGITALLLGSSLSAAAVLRRKKK